MDIYRELYNGFSDEKKWKRLTKEQLGIVSRNGASDEYFYLFKRLGKVSEYMGCYHNDMFEYLTYNCLSGNFTIKTQKIFNYKDLPIVVAYLAFNNKKIIKALPDVVYVFDKIDPKFVDRESNTAHKSFKEIFLNEYEDIFQRKAGEFAKESKKLEKFCKETKSCLKLINERIAKAEKIFDKTISAQSEMADKFGQMKDDGKRVTTGQDEVTISDLDEKKDPNLTDWIEKEKKETDPSNDAEAKFVKHECTDCCHPWPLHEDKDL